MIAPLFLVDGHDITLFPSVEALIAQLEAQDVRDGVYEAFDATGQTIVLTAASDTSPVHAEIGGANGARLRAILIAYLANVEHGRTEMSGSELETADLSMLVGLVSSVHRRRRPGR